MSHAASPHHRTSHGHEPVVTWHACIVGAGQVIWVGKSSMVIAMSMRTKPSTEPWVHARFTFVARDQKSGGWKLVARTGGTANIRGFGLMAVSVSYGGWWQARPCRSTASCPRPRRRRPCSRRCEAAAMKGRGGHEGGLWLSATAR